MFGIPEAWQPLIISALLALSVGILIEKYRSRRPRIEYYLTSMSDFHIPPREQNQVDIRLYTHSIVVQNTGRAPATNVEIVHRINRATTQNFWYRINPDIQFVEDATPEGNLIIRIDRLLPQTWITVSYLYMYPHRVDLIHNYVASNEVQGTPIFVLFIRRTPRWLQRLFLIFSILGLAYIIQLLIIIVKKIIFKF